MIRYTLRCPEEHGFESWFRDSDSFDALVGAGQVTCPACGSTTVRKALMAPSVVTGRRKTARQGSPAPDTKVPAGSQAEAVTVPVTTGRDSELRAALRDLHRRITSGATDVGRRFATEARAIHEGTAPERAIYGEATREEVSSLLEDGVPLLPMPSRPDDHH